MTTTADPFAASVDDAAEGHVYTVTGQDWDSIAEGLAEDADERVIVNMGPQHPSTHGVLRLILELEGETVTEALKMSSVPRTRRPTSRASTRGAVATVISGAGPSISL